MMIFSQYLQLTYYTGSGRKRMSVNCLLTWLWIWLLFHMWLSCLSKLTHPQGLACIYSDGSWLCCYQCSFLLSFSISTSLKESQSLFFRFRGQQCVFSHHPSWVVYQFYNPKYNSVCMDSDFNVFFYETICLLYLIRGCWCGPVNRVETISRNIYRYLSVVEQELNSMKWKGLLYPGTFPQSPAVHLSFFSSKEGNR